MKVKFRLLFLSLFVCAFSALGQNVVENESTIVLHEKTANVVLTIESKAAIDRSSVELKILNLAGEPRAVSTAAIKILPGKRKYRFAIPLADVMRNNSNEIAWWRLSYRVGEVHGVASLSELLQDDFVLRAAAFQRILPGTPLRVRTRALDPVSERPVKGVSIKAELSLDIDTDSDDDELKIKGFARTNGDGFAFIDFAVPENIKLDNAELVLIGQKNGVVRKIEEDMDEDDWEGSVLLTADKPLYQPGQTFNVRALYLDPNNTVVSGSELELSIEDEEGTVVYRQTVKTSDFGIASLTWAIPDNAKLGTYRVVVEADEDLREDQLSFKVSRYDLPNFTVTAKADKTYYLPSDREARITVNADYLFGKPVTGGKVRVVQENERRWNYRAQTYETEEGAVLEGQADAAGKFVAKFDLKHEIATLMNNQWERYRDVSLAAYFTDATTNRTEQRRLDIRLTKEPIHIYFIQYEGDHPDLPATAYISTFYADGTAAPSNVEVRDTSETVARFRTNSLGAGKIEIDIPKERLDRHEYEIRVSARDKKGNTGTYEGSFYINSRDTIRIYPDKAIYKPGETIELDLRSNQKAGFVYVDVVKNWHPVDSRVVELHDGKAHLSLPYKPAFHGDIVIAAYTDGVAGRWDNTMRTVRAVIFPEQQNLILDAKFSKNEYRPNEEASVRFSVLDGARKPVEGAIGLGIFDKAIEERARTDAEFGTAYFGKFYRLLGYDRSFGNLTLKDINDLDLRRPIDPEMDLAAEIMLAANWYFPAIYHSGNYDGEAKSYYLDQTAKQLKPVTAALAEQFRSDHDHPTDQISLERILARKGIDFASLRDPWGQNYYAEFSVKRTLNIVEIKTSGPDKKRGTVDDFRVDSAEFAYFTKTGDAIDRAATGYRERTGGYIRDLHSLRTELAMHGVDASQLIDRWGRNYRIDFDVYGRYHSIRVWSNGPNGFYEPQGRGDDFELWKTLSDYFGKAEAEVNRVLSEEVNRKKKRFPHSENEFAALLRGGGLDIATILDGYGRAVYVVGTLESKFVDRTKIENGKTTVTPVTQEIMSFALRSHGQNTTLPEDDTTLATFSAALTEAHKGNSFAKVAVSTIVFAGAKGAISGTVLDPAGAVIPDAEITATDELDGKNKFTTRSDDAGKFLLGNLPAGRYTVHASAPGFVTLTQQNVQVRSQSRVEITINLQVGAVSEVVNVAAAASVDQTTNTTGTNITTQNVSGFKIEFPYKDQTSTPRLREYFPETLVWQPELLTDKKGRAELKFKMADNITTWKMFAIASNKKGKVGVVEKEVIAFQSFFADLDPPKFLTEGDEIHLPTQIRNYSGRDQKVDVTMDKADWFTFLGAGNNLRLEVRSGQSGNAVFGFKAVEPVRSGQQRVTAIAQSESDAIEKPVTVRPDGEEIVRSDSKVFNSNVKFDVSFPSNARPGTQKAELKIYPNLFSHVADSVEGMLMRPYGCGEQTISSTYPNLMILKFVKADSPLREKAARFLQKGYDRLTGYQVADGGFTYWGGKDTSDIALTAYALRFLNDAREFVAVDDKIIKRAEEWLVRQQRADGSWTTRYRWETADDPARTKLVTTYVTRSLAMRPGADKRALSKAFAYLKNRNAEIDEPYALALYGLASLDAGDAVTATQVAAQLEQMGIAEGSGLYWKLETNTPFYGWGTAGLVETTALVLQLLTRVSKFEARQPGETISKGLIFLLKNKDRYGVWYSTQTTINVLDAFLAMIGDDGTRQSQTLQIAINGVGVQDLAVEPDRIHPLIVDLSDKLAAGSSTVEIRAQSNSSLMAQVVATHYIDWKDSQSSAKNIAGARALSLDYKCEKQNLAIMQEVACTVQAERIGSKGYGMLLAEIGTPPGADVSRESLEAALQNDWSLSRYDILPDRIVLYMWARAGGTNFNFRFRPRYGINAQTPASIVYDYYNPEASATVTPMRFEVK